MRYPGKDGDIWREAHSAAAQMWTRMTLQTELGQEVPMWMQLLVYPGNQFDLLKNTRIYGAVIADMFFRWKVAEAETAELYEKFCEKQREAGVPEENIPSHEVFMRMG
jgi:hypothetical protein